ncbi:hypothetical protein WICPIJ_008239 [Wickerhamomyces pijperi]|uniref:Uncharacterized protein n=1 Tax=Wickerhamomyces pijperi TaxID=599730 RepID=A0A9P8PY01_WICPI|nr:hypothetical protein WICPIJ_008239 [Wickerhamomyces pijperi]
MSMDIVCHSDSKILWPSNSEDNPDLPLVGKNLTKGVRFSVQTGSEGKAALKRYKFGFSGLLKLNDLTGEMVFPLSMKFKEAQNKPDKELTSLIHCLKACSLDSASMAAHTSTPIPPALAPLLGVSPHNSSSHLPCVNLRWSSFALVEAKTGERALGKIW